MIRAVEKMLAHMDSGLKLPLAESRLDAEIGWYFYYDEVKKLRSWPYILRLADERLPQNKDLRVSDFLYSCYGVLLESANSRNDFVRLLRLWPSNTPLLIKVGRNPRDRNAAAWSENNVRRKFSLRLRGTAK